VAIFKAKKADRISDILLIIDNEQIIILAVGWACLVRQASYTGC
jgi:hypothetical protein